MASALLVIARRGPVSRARLVAALVMIAAALLAPGRSRASEACPTAPDALARLRSDLAAAVGARFDVVDGAFTGVTGDQGCFWLAKVRAREPGEFVIIAADGRTSTFRLVIASAGTSRTYELARSGGASVYPHACVGDTLILPIRVDRRQHVPSFSMPDARSALDTATFQTLREFGSGRPFRNYRADVEFRNGAGDVLRLDKSAAGGPFVNRPLTESHHPLIGWFDVRAAGNFNLMVTLHPDPAPPPQPGPVLALHATPPGAPLETLVWKWADGGELPLAEHRLRVGDRLILMTGYRTAATDRPAKQPAVEVTKRPFAAGPSPFR